jgi:uncharacterized membrane protein
VDAARGTAVALMVVYHFCWDLTYFRLVDWPLLTDWAWLAFRTAIAAAFLAISGFSLALAAGGYGRARAAAASRRGDPKAAAHGAAASRRRPPARPDWRRWARRLAVLAAAAGLISLGTWLAFPQSWIFFGILHHLAAASLLGLAFVRLRGPWVLVTIAAAVFAFTARDWLVHPTFDEPGLRWLGLMTYPPQSNDYVPLFPWFGYFLIGLAAARLILDHAPRALRAAEPLAAGRWAAAVRWAGRHSLAIYLLHQPVLMGGIVSISAAFRSFGLN